MTGLMYLKKMKESSLEEYTGAYFLMNHLNETVFDCYHGYKNINIQRNIYSRLWLGLGRLENGV
jgi:hypothetical protein